MDFIEIARQLHDFKKGPHEVRETKTDSNRNKSAMKFTLLTISTILAFALAAPAADQLAERQTPLIYWTFKDIT